MRIAPALIVSIIALTLTQAGHSSRYHEPAKALDSVIGACSAGDAPALSPVDGQRFSLRTGTSCAAISKEKAIQLIDEMNEVLKNGIDTRTKECVRGAIPGMVNALIRGGERQAIQTDLTARKAESQIVRILYATTRSETGNLIPSLYYGNSRAELKYGSVRVSIPSIRRIGEVTRPSKGFLGKEEPDHKRHFVMASPEPIGTAALFRSRLVALGDHLKTKQILIFIHGYNNSFEDAILRAAQIAADLRYRGPVVLFSWPSRGGEIQYTRDEATATGTVASFGRFLKDIGQDLCDHQVHLIAHSMGNRIVLETMTDSRFTDLELDEIILAAPDVDREAFLDSLSTLASRSRSGVTVYISQADVALAISEFIHGNARAGRELDAASVFDNVDIIETSRHSANSSHSYFADDQILRDVFYVLCCDIPADRRYGLGKDDLSSDHYDFWP